MKSSIFVLGAVILNLTACGGGGSGSDDVDVADAYADPSSLVGTWIQTNVNYVVSSGDTFKVRRQTIVVTKDGDSLRFTDCISGSSLLADVVGDEVDFVRGDVPSLLIGNNGTLTASLSFGSLATEVELNRVSRDTTVNLADISFVEPEAVSSWDQVCVETIVNELAADELKLKAVNAADQIAIGVNVLFDGDVSPGQYSFPSGSDVDGYISLDIGTLNLLNPTGTVVVTGAAETEFTFDLIMENNIDSTLIGVEGIVALDPDWFSYE